VFRIRGFFFFFFYMQFGLLLGDGDGINN